MPFWVVAAIGCGRVRDDTTSTRCEPGETIAPDDCNVCDCDDQGVLRCTHNVCNACPEPTATSNSGGTSVWAQDPSLGTCCRYDDASKAPSGWPRFDNPAACGVPGCECSAKAPAADRQHFPLRCSSGGLPATLEEGKRAACDGNFGPDAIEYLSTGCGVVTISEPSFYVTQSLTFDASSGRLIGRQQFSDRPFDCGAFEVTFGSLPDWSTCAGAETCLLCGNDSSVPACP